MSKLHSAANLRVIRAIEAIDELGEGGIMVLAEWDRTTKSRYAHHRTHPCARRA
jgi:hypothetical protein